MRWRDFRNGVVTAAVIAGGLAGAAPARAAGVINVPADRPSIQAGIDSASDGDTVVVAPGTYPNTSISRAKPSR